MGRWELLHIPAQCRTVQRIWKTGEQFLTKLKLNLEEDPAFLFLNVYSGEVKTDKSAECEEERS